uniref:Peptidase aspartic putative domain-containing protein n=1 Tax=Cacopsylla melanoneura TaxID=428564 RepID=A0A8D8QE31_9HEMI
MSTNVQKEKLRSLISRRDKYQDRMQKLFDYTTDLTATEAPVFLSRFDQIEDYYKTFDTIQDAIDTLCAAMDPADTVDTADSRATFEDLYFETKAFVKTKNLIPAPPPTISNNVATPLAPPVVVQPRLPKLEVPVFSGDLKEWSNFHSLYRSTIHRRTDITEVEKLQYLRSFLRGTPLHLIENFQLLDVNYHAAYKTLCDRYENKRVLASHHLNMILNFKPLPNSNVSGLRQFLEVFQTNVAAVKNLRLEDPGDFLLMQIALRALNEDHKRMFEDKLASNAVPTFEHVLQYVTKLCVDNEMVQFATTPSSFRSTSSSSNSRYTPSASNYNHPRSHHNQHKDNTHIDHTSYTYLSTEPASTPPSPHLSCPLCNETHPLFKCISFLKLDFPRRVEVLKNHNRCFNCLGTHRMSDCRSASTCQTCQKRHHTLIHRESNFPSFSPPSTSQQESTSSENVSCSFTTSKSLESTSVLLGTAQATILDSFGNPHPIRLICDPGSQVSLISEACVQRIGLQKHKCDVTISGVGDNAVPEKNGAVSCVLTSCHSPRMQLRTDAIVLKRITSDLPSTSIAPEVLTKFSHLPLADPSFWEPSAIDFLLGADLYAKILCSTGTNVIPGTPTAMKTTLGWILFGRAPTYNATNSHRSFSVTPPSIDSALQRTEITAAPPRKLSSLQPQSSDRHVLSSLCLNNVSDLYENRQSLLGPPPQSNWRPRTKPNLSLDRSAPRFAALQSTPFLGVHGKFRVGGTSQPMGNHINQGFTRPLNVNQTFDPFHSFRSCRRKNHASYFDATAHRMRFERSSVRTSATLS